LNDTKKHGKGRQLHSDEGWSLEDRVELEGKERAHSVSLTSEMRQNDITMYDNMLMEKILDRNNMNEAFKRVKKNKGSHGIDGITVDELQQYLRENGDQLRKAILEGKYVPRPVRRVEIPKDDGKKRKLGIPTVIDRVVQQSITQVLSPIFERIFSDNSFGFRPKRSCHDALKKCQEYINAGYKWVVDIDLASYFGAPG
jgi:RNA-directed DNA polymerase